MVTIERFTFQDKYLIDQAFNIRHQVFVIEQSVDKKEEYEFEEESIHFILFKMQWLLIFVNSSLAILKP